MVELEIMWEAVLALINRIEGPSAALVVVVFMFIALEVMRMKVLSGIIRENTKALGKVAQILTEIVEKSPKIMEHVQSNLIKLEGRLNRLERLENG